MNDSFLAPLHSEALIVTTSTTRNPVDGHAAIMHLHRNLVSTAFLVLAIDRGVLAYKLNVTSQGKRTSSGQPTRYRSS